jgi:7,8-dihydropterin-6-yl-methyl-4-(beta-D-ribofuranosyl)aminobenzene 5'-phosphate synthase
MRHRASFRATTLILLGALAAWSLSAAAAAPRNATVHSLKITALVTNVAGDFRQGQGEWGYAALVEVDGHKILYDTGASSDLVLRNAQALKIDLADVEDVVLSHNHPDHTSGLLELRRQLMKDHPRAISRVHVGAGIFEPRLDARDVNHNAMGPMREEYLALGGQFVEHAHADELLPGVWMTGPVPRHTREKNWNPALHLKTANGVTEDTIPEDSALAILTDQGVVILTGCGHAGIVNITTYATEITGTGKVLAIVGGLHLAEASEETIDWTGAELRKYGVRYLLGGHCTGMDAVYRLRQALGLDRKSAVVSAVGSSFTLGQGIDPTEIAG